MKNLLRPFLAWWRSDQSYNGCDSVIKHTLVITLNLARVAPLVPPEPILSPPPSGASESDNIKAIEPANDSSSAQLR
jgi:hypothetical protein